LCTVLCFAWRGVETQYLQWTLMDAIQWSCFASWQLSNSHDSGDLKWFENWNSGFSSIQHSVHISPPYHYCCFELLIYVLHGCQFANDEKVKG
jgi:hypothetical protein